MLSGRRFTAVAALLGLFACSQDALQPSFGVVALTAVNNKIAFASNRDANYEIYSMYADGTNQTRLTTNAATDIGPSWSPDGTKLAFTSDRDGNFEIYVMNADGSSPVRLTNNSALDGGPSWSPDGTKIAFTSDRDGTRQIYVMNVDGTAQTNVSNNPARQDEQVHWSPDGAKLTFSRSGGADLSGEVYVMNADGSGQTNLTSALGSNDAPMDWSPDGSKILMASNRDDVNYELYLMSAVDGSGVTRLTNNPAFELLGSFSPDGARIAFYTSRDGNGEIYVMNADGSGQANVSTNLATETSPEWGLLADSVTISQCKDGGWVSLGFRNQGQCMRYVETGKDSRIGQ